MRMSVGVDLHKKQFTVYWRVEGQPERGEFSRYLTNEAGYGEFEQKLRVVESVADSVRVAVESTGNTRYFKNRVEALGIAVVVVNTLKFKVVNESVKKTDRHDASTLAEFLEKDMLPVARLCSQDSEELRRLLKVRSSLVGTIVAVKNQIHGLLLSLGIESKRGEPQSKKERRRVQNVLAAQQLAAYAGLTPWVQNSAEREHHGRITRRGPTELRTALVQVVLGLVRNKRRTGAYRIMERYSRMKSQKGSGRTIIATARKLSEIIWHMLHDGQPFDELRMKSPETRRKAMEMQAAALDVA